VNGKRSGKLYEWLHSNGKHRSCNNSYAVKSGVDASSEVRSKKRVV